MQKEKVIIIGASGHAKVVTDILEKQDKYSILGFIDSKKNAGDIFQHYTILGSEEILPSILSENFGIYLFIAIGDNFIRGQVADRIIKMIPDARFATAIHPSAQIGCDVHIGEGTAIMANAVINPCTTIGRFVILNTRSSVDHDNQIGDFASLAPNATTGGNVHIGNFSALSISATVKHGVKVGMHSVIGGSAFVNKHVPDCCLAIGLPAKNVKSRLPGEKYL